MMIFVIGIGIVEHGRGGINDMMARVERAQCRPMIIEWMMMMMKMIVGGGGRGAEEEGSRRYAERIGPSTTAGTSCRRRTTITAAVRVEAGQERLVVEEGRSRRGWLLLKSRIYHRCLRRGLVVIVGGVNVIGEEWIAIVDRQWLV